MQSTPCRLFKITKAKLTSGKPYLICNMLFNPKDKIFAVKWWFGMQGKNKRQTLNFVLYLNSYTWSNHKVAHEWRLQSSKNRTNQLYVEHQV